MLGTLSLACKMKQYECVIRVHFRGFGDEHFFIIVNTI